MIESKLIPKALFTDKSVKSVNKLRDFAGNLSNASTAIVYRLDTTPPQTYPDPSGSFAAPDLIIGDDNFVT